MRLFTFNYAVATLLATVLWVVFMSAARMAGIPGLLFPVVALGAAAAAGLAAFLIWEWVARRVDREYGS